MPWSSLWLGFPKVLIMKHRLLVNDEGSILQNETRPKEPSHARSRRRRSFRLPVVLWPPSISLLPTRSDYLNSSPTARRPWTRCPALQGSPRRRLRILADAMAVLGFVERHGDLYQNAPITATFLTGRTPADLRPFLRFWNRVSYPAWTNLEAAIRTGQAQATGTWPEETQRIVSEGVAAIQAAPSQALPSTYDFGRHRRILDLGGGTGSWLRAILRQYSNLEGTLFELPPTAIESHVSTWPAILPRARLRL